MTRKSNEFQSADALGKTLFVLAGFVLLLLLGTGCGVDHAADLENLADGDDSLSQEGDTTDTIACERSTDCADGEVCDPSTLVCKTADCEADSDCPSEWSCYRSALCVPKRCKNTEYYCDSGTYCSNGYCVTAPTCLQLADLRIVKTNSIVQSDQDLTLQAVAYDVHGWPVPAPPLVWESYNTGVFEVDAETGEGRGGEETGTTTIRVRTAYEDESCLGAELSATLTVRNFAELERGFRLVLVDRFTWTPIADATVVMGEESFQSGSTPADLGVVLQEDAEDGPRTLHIFHENYHYLTLVNVQQQDLLVPLTPFVGKNKVSGVQGELDFSRLQELDGGVRLGLAGLSITESLLSNPLDLLFRGKVLSGFSSDSDLDQATTVPANMTFDFDTEGQESKTRFYATGNPDANAAWAIGGVLSASDLSMLSQELLTDGSLSAGVFFAMTLGSSGQFKHGRRENLALESLSQVPDDGLFLAEPFNVPDINGNGMIDDLIAPYTQFEDLSSDLALKEPMEVQLNIGTNRPDNWYSSQLVGRLAVVFGETDRGQRVPLGLGASFDDDQAVDGLVPEGYMEVPVTLTPPYGAMNNSVTLASVAVPLDSIQADSSPTGFSVVLRRLNWFEEGQGEETITFKPFLNFVSVATVNESKRQVNVFLDPEIDMHQVVLKKEGQRWDILFNESQEKSDLEVLSLDLPVPPFGDPLGWDMTAQAIDLVADVCLDDLLAPSGVLLHELDWVTERFSVFAVESGEENARAAE